MDMGWCIMRYACLLPPDYTRYSFQPRQAQAE